MRILFPVVSPKRGGEAIGCAEVFVDDQQKAETLPHERFSVDNTLHTWALLFPHEHWPEPLCWRPHPIDAKSAEGDEPRRWHGASANLATFLAMADAKKPFCARWLNTDRLWASAALSPHGAHAHIQEVDFIASKLAYFLETCQKHKGSGRSGVFILSAVSLQKIKKILESPLGEGVQVEVFEPSKLPVVRDVPLILLVKLNQLPALVASLQYNRIRVVTQRLAVSSVFSLGLLWLVWWWAMSFWGAKETSLSDVRPKKPYSVRTIVPRSAMASPTIPQPLRLVPIQKPVQGSLENMPPSLPLMRSTSALIEQKNQRDLRMLATSTKKAKQTKPKIHYRSTHPKKNKTETSAFWEVVIQPVGYLDEHLLEVPSEVLVQRDKLTIPANLSVVEILVVHRKDKLAYETCTLKILIGTNRLRLRPLQKRKEIAQSPSYCLKHLEKRKGQ